MNASFLELLREDAGNYYTNMVEVDGGMDHLPRAFLPDLRRRIRFGARMIAIDQTPDSVIVHYQTAAGTRAGDRGLRHHHDPVRGPPPRRVPEAVLPARSSRPSASCTTTRRPRSCSSAGGGSGRRTRTSSAADRHRPADSRHVLSPITAAKPAAASCWPATRGRRTPSGGARCPTAIASARPSTTSRRSIRRSPGVRSRRVQDVARRRVRRRRVRAVSTPDSRRCSTRTSSRPRGAFISPASTRRWRTRGSRARSSQACAPRTRFIVRSL